MEWYTWFVEVGAANGPIYNTEKVLLHIALDRRVEGGTHTSNVQWSWDGSSMGLDVCYSICDGLKNSVGR